MASAIVQWLGYLAFTQETRVQTPVAEIFNTLGKLTSDGIEPPLSDLESEVLPLHHEAMEPAQTYPSGYGARLLSECALHAQVRTLPSASFWRCCRSRGSMEERWTSDPTVACSSPAAIEFVQRRDTPAAP